MSQIIRQLAAAAVIAIAASSLAAAGDDDSRRERDAYKVTPLVSNLAGHAAMQDPVLQNAWGIAFTSGGSPFWVNDNATGCSTLYDGTGVKITALQVSIPLPGNFVPATACHANDPNNGLNPADSAVLAADESASGAVFKSLAFGVNPKGAFLFAADFRNGTIDVFGPNGTDGLFTKTTLDGNFTDPEIPPGYAPFNIVNVDGDLFVTYAKQDAARHDDVAGPGHGFVDLFDTSGHLLRRFDSHGRLNSPWGVARGSFAFGRWSGKILIGNFGDGRINVFNNDGTFLDQLEDSHGKPLVIDGLWTLTLGGGLHSSPDTLYFSAGPNGETNGLFGAITPVPVSY